MKRSTFLKQTALGLGALLLPRFARPANPSFFRKKVLIIGAGMAGAAAAQRLVASGFDVTVLEARDRTGGRIHTFSDWGLNLELGANWIHNADHPENPLAGLAKKMNVTSRETDYTCFRLFDEQGKKISRLRTLLYSMKLQKGVEKAAGHTGTPDESLQAVLDRVVDGRSLSRKQKSMLTFFENANENNLAASLANSSAQFYLNSEFLGTSGKDLLVTGGYDRLPAALLEGAKVLTGRPVQHIREQAGRVTVETATGETFEADFAIVTVPLGVLQAGGVTFDPVLPEAKKRALGRLRMGHFNKVAMQFSEKFWRGHTDFLVFLDDLRKNLGLAVNFHHYGGQPILVALPVAASARWVEQAGEQAVRQRWTDILHRAYPNRNIDMQNLKITGWGTDPYAQGAYSFVPVGAGAADFEALAGPHGRIHFAGEATIARFHSTVHGAYLSGVREAEQVVKNAN